MGSIKKEKRKEKVQKWERETILARGSINPYDFYKEYKVHSLTKSAWRELDQGQDLYAFNGEQSPHNYIRLNVGA